MRTRAYRRTPWTDEELTQLRVLYPHHPTWAVAEVMGRSYYSVIGAAHTLGLHKSAEYMASPDACRLRGGDNIGAAFRFLPGQTPANKGLRRPGYAPGRMGETQFKRGRRPENWKPIGTIVTDSQGYRRIKVREHRKSDRGGWDRNVWPQLHWHVWRKHHGRRVPKGHALVFRDGDRANRANCAIENLELISRAELMARNTIHNLPPELQQVIQLNGAVKRRIRRLLNAEKHNDRPA
jgi:HNH endonuclease